MWSAPGKPARVASLIASSGLLSDSAFSAANRIQRVVELTSNIVDNSIVIHGDTQDLSLPVDSNDTILDLVLCCGEDCLSGDTIHVDTLSRLEVVEVNESKLGDEVNDTMALRDLHGNGEVVGGLGREEDFDCLFLERWIWRLVTYLYNVKLIQSALTPPSVPLRFNPEAMTYHSSCGCPDGESKELGRLRCRVHLERGECCSMSFDRLRDSPLDRVELECSLDLESRWVLV